MIKNNIFTGRVGIAVKHAYRLARGHIWKIALLCFVYMLISLASVLQAMATRNFVDSAVAQDLQGFLLWIGVFFGLIFFQLVTGIAADFLFESTEIAINQSIRHTYFKAILTRDHAAIKALHSGDLMQRLLSDTSAISGNLVWIPCELCSLTMKLTSAVIYLAVLDWRLAAVLVGCFLAMSIFALPLRRIIQRFHKQVMEKEGNLKSYLQEIFDNLLVVQSFQAGDQADRRLNGPLEDLRSIRMRRRTLSAGMSGAASGAINFAYMLGLGWCGLGIVRGSITFGTLSAVWQLVGQITGPAMRVSNVLPQYYAMTASAERLQELEAIAPEQADPTTPWQTITQEFTGIRLEELSFSYHKEDGTQVDVLNGLSTTIHSGDFVAITGQSGIGKSTLLKLLLGIYHPGSGRIQVLWGENTAPLDAGARSLVTYVPQGNFLMSGSIQEAIHFWSDHPLDEDRLKLACDLAEVTPFLQQLPQGLDTQLGERGAGLSEGQLQRIALARAIYSGKRVLLLDEATSALDEETEARVLSNLRQLKDRTVVIVTHRKAALAICNRVVALEDGRMREIV